MDQQEIIAALECRASAIALPMSEICRRAGVHPTTFSRWKLSKRNPLPIGATLSSLNKLEGAMVAAEKIGLDVA